MGTKFPLFQSAAQRAHYSKRRKEIWEALHPEPSVDYGQEDGGGDGDPAGGATCATSLDHLPDGRKKGPQHYQAFAAATAEVTGQSKAQINRNVARAEVIGDDLLRLTGTSLDMASQNATPLARGQHCLGHQVKGVANSDTLRKFRTPTQPENRLFGGVRQTDV